MTESHEAPSLERLAFRHAVRLQLTIGVAFVLLSAFASLFKNQWEHVFPWAGFTGDDYLLFFFVPTCMLISMQVNWSAIWITLGPGRWSVQAALSFGQTIVFIGVCFLIDVFLDESTQVDRFDALAMIAGVVYAMFGHFAMSLIVVRCLKLLRFQLVYFDHPASYPHPRIAARQMDVTQRAQTVVFSNRFHLVDLLVITTTCACFLAVWFPIRNVLQRDAYTFFGPDFVFVLCLVTLLSAAAIGLVLVLLPMVISMSDRKGIVSQVMWHFGLINLLGACLIGLRIVWENPEEVDVFCATMIVVFVFFQFLLFLLLRRPSQWFRFRLLRRPKANLSPVA